MWYPNKAQWMVIWFSAAAIIAILVLRLQQVLYMDRGIYVVAIILIAGSLLVWQLSDKGDEKMKVLKKTMRVVRSGENTLSLTMPESHIEDYELNEVQLQGFIRKYESIGHSHQEVTDRVSSLAVGETIVFHCMSKI